MADECLDEVNERATSFVDVSFFDEDGVAAVPTAATVRIDDVTRRQGVEIRGTTVLGGLASTITIRVESSENRILNTRKAYEVREMTVEFDYLADSGSAHGVTSYRYKVINKYGVPLPSSPSQSPSESQSPSASASPSA